MWIARAEYADGSSVEKMFDPNPYRTDADDQYEIECWLLEYRERCTWYSVDWVNDVDYDIDWF